MKNTSLLFLLVCTLGSVALVGCDQNSNTATSPSSTNTMPSTNMTPPSTNVTPPASTNATQ